MSRNNNNTSNTIDNLNETISIHQVVESGNYDLFKYLIDSDINLIDTVEESFGRTPLIICSFKKTDSHFKIAKCLLDSGCDVNIQANYKWNNWNALMTASFYGNSRMVEILINANANLDLIDINTNTAWQLALENSHNDCVQIILNEMELKQIDARLKLEKELQDAVFNNDYEGTKNCLRNISKDNVKQVINSTTSGNHTLLYRACRNGNPKIVDLLIEYGAIARPHYYTKYSPLYIACHMGNLQISQMILNKFPHLIKVTTIENFLPYHATCSQGHIDILKLLINYEPPQIQINSKSIVKNQPIKQIYADSKGNKYLSMFDLNALDVNDQSGLYSAVLANRYNICEYLLSLKVKKLTESDISKQEKRLKQANNIPKAKSSDGSVSLFTSFLSSLSSDEINPNGPSLGSSLGGSSSFFDHLKNVFLDPKPIESYVVVTGNDNDKKAESKDKDSSNEEDSSVSDNKLEDIEEYFNPIEINTYSKFGYTCLHEAIKKKNYLLVNLLLNHGADANLPIYDVNINPNQLDTSNNNNNINKKVSSINQYPILSNCLCEAIKQLDEQMFLLVLDHVSFNEFDFKIIFKLCIELMNTRNDSRLSPIQSDSLSNFGKKVLSYLMQLKIINDTEYKINIRNKLSSKLINNLIGLTTNTHDTPVINPNSLLGPSFDNGLILNWNNLEPKLTKVYESWLHNSTKYFKFSNKNLILSNSPSNDTQLGESPSTEPSRSQLYTSNSESNQQAPLQPHPQTNLSLKKLHFHVITRVDFSYNNLELLPYALFQIESLKFMKLSFNRLKKLPISRNYELDDVNKISLSDSDNFFTLNWNCHALEELDLDNNQLVELPVQIFQLKSLRHLNVSTNKLEKLPIELWQAPSLFDLNASYNKLTHLPLVGAGYNLACGRGRTVSNPIPYRQNRSRRDELAPFKQSANKQQKTIPVHDHPLKSPVEEKLPPYAHKPPPQNQALYTEKQIDKANYWHLHSIQSSFNTSIIDSISDNSEEMYPDNNVNVDKSLKAKLKINLPPQKSIQHITHHNHPKESKLIELNLSNNEFVKMPECLSCLTPKLVKLNLSSNKIESMGAICDLPLSLKFLDLSNNFIKRPMRLLNENLLKFIFYYFTKYSTSGNHDDVRIFNLNNILVNLLLDNEFCYFNIVQKSLLDPNKPTSIDNRSSRNTLNDKTNIDSSMQSIRSKTRAPPQLATPSSAINLGRSNPIQALNDSRNNKRRTRSQSRSQNKNLISPIVNNGLPNQISPGMGYTNSNRRLLPFDLFLINLKYNSNYSNDKNSLFNNSEQTNFDISKLIESLLRKTDDFDIDLDRKERLILNNNNIQVFLEQLCPHKRHIKLENLKSLNLSHNKIKKCNLMFDLSNSNVIDPENISLIVAHRDNEPKIFNQMPSSSILADSVNSGAPNKFLNKNVKNIPVFDESSSIRSNAESITSESDWSNDDMSSSEIDYSSDDQADQNKQIEHAKAKQKTKRNRLKDKLSTFSPLKKKLSDSQMSPSKKKSPATLYINKNEERANMISKLMFPNLTHLDLSSNKLKRVPGSLALLENLSYLNVSSNQYLTRVSPQIGILSKLWNFDLKNCSNLRDPINLDNLVKQRTKTSDILGYLKSILEHSRPYTRIKLMFVGVQAIGKTSLLNKLREEGTSNNKQSWSERVSSSPSNTSILSSQPNISTVGIDINEWVYEKPKQKLTTSSTVGSLQQHQQQQQQQYIYQMDNSINKTFGPIMFRTWDFGGQREYYSTHQYFLSKRALYLVCWKLSEEEKGINEIHHWLSNIQTRAPGSPVIIVGTHQDQLAKLKNYKEISNYLQRLIYERFVRPSSETETTSAYPPIMASIEVSSKTGHNIKALAKLVYDVAVQMKAPGVKDQLLLEQKIPVTYLALEECISYVLQKLKAQNRNPVLNTSNYLKEIRFAIDVLYPDEEKQGMPINETHRYNKLNGKHKKLLIRFRDDAEILQATQFLHENGILIHYNDVALRDIFFLDPQWLCDILATVVTIREINPFAAKGIMKIKDLLVLFKGSRFTESEEIMSFIVDLLGKFELALTWDNEHLLIPPLLPSEAMLKFSNQDIRISIVSKQRAYSDHQNMISYNNLVSPQIASSTSCITSFQDQSQQSQTQPQEQSISSLYSSVKLVNSYSQMTIANKLNLEFLYECKPYNSQRYNTEALKELNNSLNETYLKQQKQMQNSIRRLYSLTYLPNGFFSRLITRILCDNILKECLLELIELEYCLFNRDFGENSTQNVKSKQSLDPLIDFVCQEAEWKCWQTGIELKYLDYTLIRVKELIQDPLLDFNGSISMNVNNNSSTRSKNANDIFLNNPVLYRDCENEFKLKSASKQCTFLECYASFRDYKIVKSKSSQNQAKTNSKSANKSNYMDEYIEIDESESDDEILVKILCNRQVSIKIFALIIEIIDSLLEDWYPDLGTRFMQDSKGDYLVTRLAPCSDCVRVSRHKANTTNRQRTTSTTKQITDLFLDTFSTTANEQLSTSPNQNSDLNNWNFTEIDDKFKIATVLADNVSLLVDTNDLANVGDRKPLKSSSSSATMTSNESGVANLIENCEDEERVKLKLFETSDWIFCFMIDDICYSVLKSFQLNCPKHGSQHARAIAPDLAFDDIDEKFLVTNQNLKIESLLGRGSFGSVFCGSLFFRNTTQTQSNDKSRLDRKNSLQETQGVKVAVKVLETLSNSNNSIDFEKNFINELSSSPQQFMPKMASDKSSDKLNRLNSEFNDEQKKHRASFNKYWNYRKSIRLAAKAYTVARQEIAILSSLKHENIVAMLGLSIQPLAIILELAPLGNLKDILTDYKTHMCKLIPLVIQRVASQISSALVYLHSNKIIYRDLKADNVLVWKFPRPNQLIQSNIPNSNTSTESNINFTTNNVYLKLADYSISRCVLPTGTKGFAGTPGFMAPEILKFNGEETYSEKVDCFSFAMLLYELISLKHPFEGQEQIKDIILNGGRPLIKNQELLYPTLMLDLMCLCWLENPADRPSAGDIFKYAKSYEFSHLLDVTVLEDYEKPPLVLTCLNQEREESEQLEDQAYFNMHQQMLNDGYGDENEDELVEDEEIEEEDVVDLWIARNSTEENCSQFEVLTYENKLNCTNRKIINVSNEPIEAICLYNTNQIWCIDSSKSIYIYCSRTFKKISDYMLDITSKSPVVSMFPLQNMNQILLCTGTGIIMLLKVDLFHSLSLRNNNFDHENEPGLNDELEYVVIDLAIKVNTSIVLPTRYDKNYDLWLGSENGEIFCFSLKDMRLTGSYLHSSSHHYLSNSLTTNRQQGNTEFSSSPSKLSVIPTETHDSNVTIIKTTPNDTFFLWSYVYPGSTIFLWNHVSKKIMSAYNCKKAYEELSFKEHFNNPREFRIVDITFLNGQLYCGINSGIVLVLKRLTLTPMLIFSAHMHQINSLCPITFETSTIQRKNFTNKSPIQSPNKSNSTRVVKKTQHMMLTLGRALAPVHEDIYLSSNKYRVDALRKYAGCLIINAWNSS